MLVNSDFYLERITSNGAERVEKAVLLSNRELYAYVRNGGTTAISYWFGVDGDLIDFRNGTIQIGVQVELPGQGQGGAAGSGD